MLNADSRTLKKPSEPQRSATAPMIPIDVAWSWIERTTVRRRSTELAGKARRSSSTR